MPSFLPFTSRSRAATDTEAPLGTVGGGKQASASPFSRFKQAAAEMTSSSSSTAGGHMLVPGAPLPHIVLPVVHGGHVELGSPTGEFVLIVVARGRVCPVSRNYVAALAELSPELEALGVETIVVSGSDGRAAAAAFGDAVKAAASTAGGPGGAGGAGAGASGGGASSAPGSPVSHPLDDLPFKLAYGMTPEMMKAWGLYASAPRLPPPAPAGRGSASAAAAAAGEEEMAMTTPSSKTTASGQQQQLMQQQQRRAMPEPALLLLDADGQVVFADVSNSPFCRTDLALMIEGIRFVLETGYPTRGTLFFEE